MIIAVGTALLFIIWNFINVFFIMSVRFVATIVSVEISATKVYCAAFLSMEPARAAIDGRAPP